MLPQHLYNEKIKFNFSFILNIIDITFRYYRYKGFKTVCVRL